MSELGQRGFSGGWKPDQEDTNADPNCLLRMDNLFIDEHGAIELVRGTQKINKNPLGGYVNKIYSRYINGTLYRYVSYSGLTGGIVVRDLSTGNFADATATLILVNGNIIRTCFGNGFGEVFIASGNQRIKDNVTIYPPQNLGFDGPTKPPGLTQTSAPVQSYAGTWNTVTLLEGSGLINGADYAQGATDATSNRIIFQQLYPAPLDLFQILNQGVGPISIGTDTDTIKLGVRVSDTQYLISVRLTFLLTTPDGTTNDTSDYLYFEWPLDNSSSFNLGKAIWSTLQAQRKDFTRVGSNNALDWHSVVGWRVTFIANASEPNVAISDLNLYGGSQGPLTGTYEYVQVDVNDNGSYVAKSKPSPSTGQQYIFQGQNILTPYEVGMDPQVNQHYFYRRGNTLDQFYFVGSCPMHGTFTDTVDDFTALELNTPLNNFLESMQNTQGDEVLQILGPIAGRMLYMMFNRILVSDELNPDFYDTRQVIITGSNVGEKNLFICQTTNSVIILATTQNFYEITGTFELLPDGTMDVTIRPLGIAQPSISQAFAIQDNTLFYIAQDGVRVLAGIGSQLLTQELTMLFKGIARYGVPGVLVAGQNTVIYDLAIAKNKLWVLVYHNDFLSVL